jgi:hypothetical protein
MKSGGVILKDGVIYYPDYLSLEEQLGLLQATREIVAQAPLFQPRMPRTNTPFSVKMTNCGVLGWVSDVKGYRYQETHPDTEKPWPAMPDRLLETWQALSNYHAPPEACLINFYDQAGRPYIEETGSGKPLIEIMEQPQFAVQYNDVGNEPYFIAKYNDINILWIVKMS